MFPLEQRLQELEDLTVYRDRVLLHAWQGKRPFRLSEMYSSVHPELTTPGSLRLMRDAIRQRYPSPPTEFVSAFRWLVWLTLEHLTAEELDTLRQQQVKQIQSIPNHHRPHPFAFLRADPSPEPIRFYDSTNPARIRWFQAWGYALEQLQHEFPVLPFVLPGVPIDAWKQVRVRELDTLLDQTLRLHHSLQPDRKHRHWSDYAIPPAIFERLFGHLTRPHRDLIRGIWEEILGFPTDLNARYRLLQPATSAPIFGPARRYFDGQTLHLIPSSTADDPLEVLFLWGSAQPALWTPLDYSWHRLYGGDPSIPLAWGYWLLRWFLRQSGWQAIGRDSHYHDARDWFAYMEGLIATFFTIPWPWTLSAFGVASERLPRLHEQWTGDLQNLIGVRVEPELVLALVLNRGWTFIAYRAWHLAGAVHNYLEWVYGSRWYQKREARHLLTDFWSHGTDMSIETAMKEWGADIFDESTIT